MRLIHRHVLRAERMDSEAYAVRRFAGGDDRLADAEAGRRFQHIVRRHNVVAERHLGRCQYPLRELPPYARLRRLRPERRKFDRDRSRSTMSVGHSGSSGWRLSAFSTSYPCSTKCLTTQRPSMPLPPVTTTFSHRNFLLSRLQRTGLVQNLFYPLQHVFVKLDARRLGVLRHLLRTACADQCARDVGLTQNPGQGQVADGNVQLSGDAVQLTDLARFFPR